MGQKSNPIGLRLGIIRSWDSKWFAQKEYIEFIHEDLWIKQYLRKKLANGELARVEIERPSQKKLKVTLSTAKPGVVIGKGGAEINNLKAFLEKKTGRQVYVNINEIKEPMLEAQLVAQNIAGQLERRVSYRRAMKRTMELVLAAGAEGVKTRCSGRLGGAEIARTEEYAKGRVPLHTLRANIDYGFATAYTSYGTCGVKVWIFHGEVLDPKEKARLTSQRMPAPGEILAEAEPRQGLEAIAKIAGTPGSVDEKKPEGGA